MRSILQDLRYGVRQLRGNPGFTALVVLTVALGIGANTAIFSLLNGFLRPLPVPAPGQVVFLAAQTKGDETGFQWRFSYPALEDFRNQADCFSDVFAFNAMIAGLNSRGKVTQFLYSAVSGNFFTGLGVRPAAGRLFDPGEGERPGSPLVVVLGYSYWQKRFAGDRAVVGREVRINGHAATVVGVVPKGFNGLYAGAEMDGYLPLNSLGGVTGSDMRDYYTSRVRRVLTLIARMKPGVTMAQAQAAAQTVTRRLEVEYPITDKDIGVRIIPETLARPMPLHYLADRIPIVRGLLLTLAGVVLLLACLNVANILLVRATIRQREMAIRAALGSGRGRLVRQMLTESAILALLGGIGGLIIGRWGSDAFASSIDLATDFPIHLDFSFDWRVFTYALTAAVVTGIVIGLWPALRASRTDPGGVLHDGARDSAGRGRQRVRSVLVVGQVAGSLVLLIVAGLFAASLRQAQRMDLGFDADHLLNARLDPLEVGYDRARTNQFYRELERRARAIPGVQSASLAFSAPMGYIFDGLRVHIEGRQETPGEQPPVVSYNTIGTDYFATMRIPILHGRAFRETDTESAPPVAIINQAAARRFWPGEDPIGKRLRVEKHEEFMQVVGVAQDSKYLVVFESALPYLYVPAGQWFSSMRVLQVRAEHPEQLRQRIAQEIAVLDPEMPVADLQTMRQALAGGMGFMMFRVGAVQAGSLGVLGLILAVIGVYGVVSHGAAQRTREIGIRMALGAAPSDVRSLVLGQGLVLVIAGVAIGIAVAAALTRVAGKYILLHGGEPLTFVAISLLLAAIALFACYVPARRAMRVDPIEALRHE